MIGTVANNARFRKLLLAWFDREKRDLPWRGERDPFRILVSEIMLQQTRVAVVEDRYRKFLLQFPSVARLAAAREQSVLAAWSGLGYYRRARSLHAAAKKIRNGGAFPSSATALQELPGVGRYTANAVASIAFGEPVPVVDGNVKRLLGRFTGKALREDECWKTAGTLLEQRRPGDFNQAMMELGALVCLPARPLCAKCPVARLCTLRGAEPRRKQALRRKAILNYALVRRNGSILLQQRPAESSLMPGMWELPAFRSSAVETTPILKLRHSITTTDYSVLVFPGKHGSRGRTRWVSLRSAERLPLTGLARKILCAIRSAAR
jgi:A/G-specific adenine glycosylase